MAFDYSQIVKDAESIVNEFGRDVTFVKFDEVATDTTKPWRGAVTPRDVPENSITLKAVFVPPSSANKLGFTTVKPGMVDRQSQILIIAPGTTHEAVEFEQFDEVVDGTVKWKIDRIEALKPGSTRLLYFVEVER